MFLMNLAESMISIFVPIYLYYLHYSVTQILFFFFLSSLGSVVLALPAAKMVAKLGAKHSILFSTPFLIIYYLGLYLLEATPWLFYLLPLFLTLRCLFYNFGFDLNFVDHLDRRRVGKLLSSLATFSIFGAILSPLVAGLIIAFSGFVAVFLIGS
ncbi:MAG: Major facilitator superfamily, partial [Candidatus Magasanikbacteria bacterium GW2011_GWA2_41_55]